MNRTACLVIGGLFLCFALFLPLKLRAQEGAAEAYDLLYRGLYQEIGIGDLSGAIKTYNQIADGPLHGSELAGKALLRKAVCLEMLGEETEAINCYNKVIVDFPEKAFIKERALEGKQRIKSQSKFYVSEGLRMAKRGEFEDARKKFRNALLLEPDDHHIQAQIAAVCKKLGYYKEAIRHYEDVVALDEYRNDLLLHRELAECHKQDGNFDEAIKVWRNYLREESPDGSEKKMAAFELSLLYEDSDYLQNRNLPGKLQEYLAEGEECTRDNNCKKAIKIYQLASDGFPRSHLPAYRLAFIYDYLLIDPYKAIRHYKNALSIASLITAQRIRIRLGILYERTGELDNAETYIDQYFMEDIQPVEDAPGIRERIKDKKMKQEATKREQERRKRKRRETTDKQKRWEKVQKLKKKPKDE